MVCPHSKVLARVVATVVYSESLPWLVVNGRTSSLWSRPRDLSWPCCWLCPADSIEANVESSEVHVERGAEQLQRAVHYQVRALLLLLLLLSLQVAPGWEKKPNSSFTFTSSLSSLLQQKSRKKMCILAVVCSIALAILIIIVWKVSS